MNWPYWKGLILLVESGCRAIVHLETAASIASSVSPSNQAVPVPLPKPTKKRAIRVRPSPGGVK